MNNLISALRDILGTTNGFYHSMGGGSYASYQWDYGLIIEYLVASILLGLCISSVFKLLRCLFK